MKLCRFELREEPGQVRSGMVFSGKIYETDGATAVGVHEADAIRPLAPVPTAPCLRIFRNEYQPLNLGVAEEPHFYYGNPASVAGPSQIINFPGFTTKVSVLPMVAAVAVSPSYRAELDYCDDMILGLTMLCLLTAPIVEDAERKSGGGAGRSIDLGAVMGPVITTPDELDDFISDQEFGRKYQLGAITRHNGIERDRGNLENLPWSFAEALFHASQSCTVKEGDIFAMGSVVESGEAIALRGGDEFQLSIDQLGTLSLRLEEDL